MASPESSDMLYFW